MLKPASVSNLFRADAVIFLGELDFVDSAPFCVLLGGGACCVVLNGHAQH